MKKNIFILIACIVAMSGIFLFLTSGKPKKLVRLAVTIEHSYGFGADTPKIASLGFFKNYRTKKIIDQSGSSITYIFTGVAAGVTEIQLDTIGNLRYSQLLNLRRDTAILITEKDCEAYKTENAADLNISNLSEGEIVTVEMNSSGCFHSTRQKLIIQKKKDRYAAGLIYSRWGGYLYVEKGLDLFVKDSIAKFQTSCLSFIKEYKGWGGCTTTTRYLVKRGNKAWQFTDGDCTGWDGYYKLINTLMPESNIEWATDEVIVSNSGLLQNPEW